MSLNSKSIENAIKQIKKAQSQLDKMVEDFLFTCCTYIYDKANDNLRNSEIGEDVKRNIMSGWQIPEIRRFGNKTIATLRNTDSQAVYVEFGVGIVGSYLPHERVITGETDYEYNIPTQHKSASGQWVFSAKDDSFVDLDNGYYIIKPNKLGENWVITKGSPALMYAYNACVDLQAFEFKRIWENIKKKYWG